MTAGLPNKPENAIHANMPGDIFAFFFDLIAVRPLPVNYLKDNRFKYRFSLFIRGLMKRYITRRHFIKCVLSNATFLTMSVSAFPGQLTWPSSETTCPNCRFPCDFFPWIDSYCHNCGINLRTLKHHIKCDQYVQCRQKKLPANEKNQNNQSACDVCWNIPFRTIETGTYSEKPWINLNELNF
jgi:hypothetical protein